ncbi:MAG: hypothetical protein AAF371_07655, partial [Pseudomonadota bacterium]
MQGPRRARVSTGRRWWSISRRPKRPIWRSPGGLGTERGGARIFYAAKANPHPAVLARLTRLGASFNAASRGEIGLCLAEGASRERISFGNTVKRPADIAFAHAAGIGLFVADASEEVAKIAANAPGARVFSRLRVEENTAARPLGRKFGAGAEEVVALAERLGRRHLELFERRLQRLSPARYHLRLSGQTRALSRRGPPARTRRGGGARG